MIGDRDLDPVAAYEAAVEFGARNGEQATRLALHASVPQVFRPELLHLIALNFVSESMRDRVAESDVLSAPFCEDLGNGYHRFEPTVRRYFLSRLDVAYAGEAAPRSRRVASFLARYLTDEAARAVAVPDQLHREYLEIERWVALAFLDPGLAAAQFARVLQASVAEGVVVARVRVSGLTRALATPLAGYTRLIAYGASIEALSDGRAADARRLLESVGDAALTVGSVTIESPSSTVAGRLRAAVRARRRRAAAKAAPKRTGGVVTFLHGMEDAHLWQTLRPLVDRLRLSVSLVNINGDAFETAADVVKQLGDTTVAVLLVSRRAIHSTWIRKTVVPLVVKEADAGRLALTWICLEPCAWHDTPIARHQAAHDPAKSLATLSTASLKRELAAIGGRIVGLAMGRSARGREGLSTDVPVLFLVSQVIFPFGASQVRLRMASNLRLLDELPGPDANFVVAFARGDNPEKVSAKDIATIGVAARVIARLKLPDMSEQVTVQGLRRVLISEIVAEKPYFRARVAPVVERLPDPRDAEAEISTILDKVDGLSKLDPTVQAEHVAVLRANIENPSRFADLVPSALSFDVEEQRHVIELAEILPRLRYVADRAQAKLEFARVVQETDSKVRQPETTAGLSIVFVGHTVDRPNRVEPRFPPGAEHAAYAAIRGAIEAERSQHGPISRGLASGSDGGDILFHEACAELGIPTTVFVPVGADEFVSRFLLPAGGDWAERFARLTKRCPVVLQSPASPEDLGTYRDDPWFGNADSLLAHAVGDDASRAVLLAFWNGEWGGPGGPAHMIEKARAMGVRTDVIDTRKFLLPA